ncbi:hypothetical protein CBR_g41608 [Chara braunii]|uniref:Integrase catalytic domain-containing protein n=1 Tax=Chara braunii TaxID=69332 RepID=A0A388LWA4_CHABU|nr:hypothetical protein CBR_g41608 [Chara braunii]|eukprot:GBG86545.1 hypothetical protein CBR_g41608 [Chara braunii]
MEDRNGLRGYRPRYMKYSWMWEREDEKGTVVETILTYGNPDGEVRLKINVCGGKEQEMRRNEKVQATVTEARNRAERRCRRDGVTASMQVTVTYHEDDSSTGTMTREEQHNDRDSEGESEMSDREADVQSWHGLDQIRRNHPLAGPVERGPELYVETCKVSQRDKPHTQAPLGLLKPLSISERPGESLSMDFMDTLVTSKSGMRHIFVIVDKFSKYDLLVAMPETARTEYVIRMFKENWVRDFGLPKSIISDRDVRFTSELWKAAAAEQGTQLQMTPGNHPEANGQAEQLNRVVEHLLRHYIKPN